MLAHGSERFSFGTLELTFLKTFHTFPKVKSSHSSIGLLLILEQCYNSHYNHDDTAALADFRGQGALFQS